MSYKKSALAVMLIACPGLMATNSALEKFVAGVKDVCAQLGISQLTQEAKETIASSLQLGGGISLVVSLFQAFGATTEAYKKGGIRDISKEMYSQSVRSAIIGVFLLAAPEVSRRVNAMAKSFS